MPEGARRTQGQARYVCSPSTKTCASGLDAVTVELTVSAFVTHAVFPNQSYEKFLPEDPEGVEPENTLRSSLSCRIAGSLSPNLNVYAFRMVSSASPRRTHVFAERFGSWDAICENGQSTWNNSLDSKWQWRLST
eukprot:1177951-Prorocentrum_minimum.AAC.4